MANSASARGDAPAHLLLRPAHLQGPEGDLVEDGRVEELDVGVLEDEADAAAEGERRVVVGEAFFGERLAEGLDPPAIGEIEPVEEPEKRRLARAVGAEQHDALAGHDAQAEAVEGRRLVIGVADIGHVEDGRRGKRRGERSVHHA